MMQHITVMHEDVVFKPIRIYFEIELFLLNFRDQAMIENQQIPLESQSYPL